MRVDCWSFSSASLIHASILLPIPHALEYSGFKGSFEIRKGEVLPILFFFHTV